MTTTPTFWIGEHTNNTNTTGVQTTPQITGLSNGNYLVSWVDFNDTVASPAGSDIVGVIYDAEGNVVQSEFRMNVTRNADNEREHEVAATNDGGFVVVYEDSNANGVSIAYDRFDAAGSRTDGAVIANDPGTPLLDAPAIAMFTNNSFAVVYELDDGTEEDIVFKIVAADGTVGAQQIMRNDDDAAGNTSDPIEPQTVALSNSNFVTVWIEKDGGDYDVEFTIRNSSGTFVSSNLGVTSSASNVEHVDVAALAGGGFVIVYEEGGNIFSQVFENDGTLRHSQAPVQPSANNQNEPVVIGLDDGGYYVVFDDDGGDRLIGVRVGADNVGISAQQIDTGAPITGPEVSLTSDGRILVTWLGDDNDGEIHSAMLDPRDTTINLDGSEEVATTRLTDDTTVHGSNQDETILGQGGDDTINGNDGIDNISGGAGNDNLNGGSGDDIIDGGTGNDSIEGGFGTDNLNGGAGDDLIEGGLGIDNINGGVGDDTIIGTAGSFIDNVDGGAGFDTLDLSALDFAGLDELTVDLNAGTITNARVGSVLSISNIEQIIGSQVNDTISADGLGTGSPVNFNGFDGDDSLTGGNGSDTLNGGEGNDNIAGGGLFDTINGGAGDDTLDGGLSTDTINGGDGNDTIIVQDGDFFDNVDGGAGNDTLDHSAVTRSGDIFNFAIGQITTTFADTGTLTLDGIEIFRDGSGSNEIFDRGGAFTIFAGGGDDVVRENASGGTDTFNLEDGDDLLIINNNGVGFDNFDGGNGTDTIDFSAVDIFGNNPVIDLAGGTLSNDGGSSENITNFENVIGSQDNDTIIGTAGVNELSGGDGNDTLNGGDGDDLLDGGAGFDVLDMSGATAGFTLNFNGSTVTAAGLGTDTFSNVEGAIGSAFNDRFFGHVSNNAADEFSGGDGRDTFSTFGGNDLVFGDGGNDSIFLGEGDDTAEGGAGADAISGEAGNDFLGGGTENDRLFGGSGDDQLTGDAGDDALIGGGGIDQLNGGAGNDRVFADGADNPTQVFGGAGTDRLIGQGSVGLNYDLVTQGFESAFGTSGNDIFNGSGLTDRSVQVGHDGNDSLTSGAGNDLLEGRDGDDTIFAFDGDDQIRGQNGNDNIRGNAGNDTIFGGAGDDLIAGDAGNDFLQGDAGSDQLDGGAGDDDVRIDSADDPGLVFGGSGNDTVRLLGSDNYGFNLGDQGFERGFGNSGDNTLDASTSGVGVSIFGLGGDDILIGSDFVDSLVAADGNDIVHVGLGADSANGGNGTDTAVFAGVQADYTVNVVNPGVSTKVTHIATGDVNSLSAFEFAQFDDGTIAI